MTQQQAQRRESPKARLILTLIVVVVVAVGAFLLWRSPAFQQIAVPASPTPTQIPTTSSAPTTAPTGAVSVTPEPDASLSPTPASPSSAASTAAGAAQTALTGTPSKNNLPDAAMVAGGSSATLVNEYEGPGQEAKGLCDPGRWGDPTFFQVRVFNSKRPTGYVWASVLGYRSPEEAQSGFDMIRQAAASCDKSLKAEGLKGATVTDSSAKVPFDASSVSADVVKVAYYSATAKQGKQQNFGDSLLVRADNRLLWVASSMTGTLAQCSAAPAEGKQQCALAAGLDEMLVRLAS